MEAINLIDSFAEFKELKNIDRATLMRVLEDIFRNMLIKRYGTDENFDIIINIDKGDLEIWRNRIVVEDDAFEDPNAQISLTEAKKIDADYEVGEEVTDEVKFKDFGRRSVLALRQNLSARILELEKDHIFTKYKEKVGQIVTGEVYQVWKKEVLILDDEENELGVRCVAVAIPGADGRAESAFSISGLAPYMTPERIRRIATLALDARTDILADLGLR